MRLSGALVRPFETEKLTQEIVDTTAEMLNAEVCSLWVVDRTGRKLVHQANHGFGGRKRALSHHPTGTIWRPLMTMRLKASLLGSRSGEEHSGPTHTKNSENTFHGVALGYRCNMVVGKKPRRSFAVCMPSH